VELFGGREFGFVSVRNERVYMDRELFDIWERVRNIVGHLHKFQRERRYFKLLFPADMLRKRMG
jgi:hypothetical protein